MLLAVVTLLAKNPTNYIVRGVSLNLGLSIRLEVGKNWRKEEAPLKLVESLLAALRPLKLISLNYKPRERGNNTTIVTDKLPIEVTKAEERLDFA